MCDNASSRPEAWDSKKKPDQALSVDKGSPEGPHGKQPMTMSSQKREQILGLIAQGEELIQAANLCAFYQWMQESYEVLEFHPTQQRLFEEYCRSSDECDFIVRALSGLWALKWVLRDPS